MILAVMFIDRVSGKGNAIGRVRLFLLYSLNQLTFDIDFFHVRLGYDNNSPRIESQGYRSRSQVIARL